MLKPELASLERSEKKEFPKEIQKELQEENIRLKFKIRFDYKGKAKPPRFFFGGKKAEIAAQDIREKQVTLWRNMPLQGLSIDDVEMGDIYYLYDEDLDEDAAYAPLEMMVTADSLEDLLHFVLREEFRRIEILEPKNIRINNRETERLFFKINELMQSKISMKRRTNKR